MLAMEAGTEFVTTTVALVVGGWLLDRYLDTVPGWTLAGLALGLVVATIRLLQMPRRIYK